MSSISIPSKTETDFKDVLSEIRQQYDLVWINRTVHLKTTRNELGLDIDPLLYRYKVLVSTEIQDVMKKEYPNESAACRFFRINNMLSEMGCSKNNRTVRWLGFILLQIMKRVHQALLVNEVKFLKIRREMGKNPVIFVPTHRSYADFILIAFLCFTYEIEIPIVVAGMDFQAMFGMATILRQCGAMYMRRSFRDDQVYGTVLKKYIQTVITEGNSPFEFFIEGTRSRSGKSLMPKLGILKIIVDLYKNQLVSDVTIIPVSINYDKIMEDNLFVHEMLGIPKPKESTKSLFRSLTMLAQYGNIYINIGDEISLKKFVNNCETKDYLLQLGQTIVKKQQENLVLGFINIFALAILYIPETNDKLQIERSILMSAIVAIKNVLKESGAVIQTNNNNDDDEMKRCSKIHEFIQLHNDGSVINPIYDVHDTNTKAKLLIMLQHYSNPCYYFLCSSLILLRIVLRENKCNIDALYEKYHFFRSIFKHEFLFTDCTMKEDFDKSLKTLSKLNMIRCEGTCVKFNLNEIDDLWLNIMSPFLKGYLFILKCIRQLGSNNIPKSLLRNSLRRCIEMELELSDDPYLYYSLSSNFVTCILSSLEDMKITSNKVELFICDSVVLSKIIDFLEYLVPRTNYEISQTPDIFTCKL